MKLRFFYTLGLLFCLSNFASPNECARHCPLAAASAGQAASTAPAASAPQPSAAAATETATGQGESNSPTLIKLLYI
jgi:hypothetical protein